MERLMPLPLSLMRKGKKVGKDAFMKNTSTIGHSSKHTFLPVTTFTRKLGVNLPTQSPWLQQQLSGATTVCVYCLQVSSHNSCCTNLLRNRFLWKKTHKKLSGHLGWSALPLSHTKRRPLFRDRTNNTALSLVFEKGKALAWVQLKREKLGKQQRFLITFTVTL